MCTHTCIYVCARSRTCMWLSYVNIRRILIFGLTLTLYNDIFIITDTNELIFEYLFRCEVIAIPMLPTSKFGFSISCMQHKALRTTISLKRIGPKLISIEKLFLLSPLIYVFQFFLPHRLSYRQISAFQVFPHKFHTSLQLFELEDEYIQEEIRKPSEEASCSVSLLSH